MNIRFDGKVVIITGATRGIGYAMAQKFADAGAVVYGTYLRSDDIALRQVDEAKAKGLNLSLTKVDSASFESCEAFVQSVLAKSSRLDVIVNNSGITNDKLALQMEKEDFTKVLETNLFGAFYLIRAALPSMVRQRSGSIINLSSLMATRPGKGQVNYAASKGAVESLTKALAQEVGGRNVRVNAIAPGMIETDMSAEILEVAGAEILARTALKRFGSPNDIAHVAMFLASEYAAYMTGQILHVNGGV